VALYLNEGCGGVKLRQPRDRNIPKFQR